MAGLGFRWWILCAASLLVATVTACREEEQGRVLRFDKGTYVGAPDTRLTAEQVEALVQRSGGPQI